MISSIQSLFRLHSLKDKDSTLLDPTSKIALSCLQNPTQNAKPRKFSFFFADHKLSMAFGKLFARLGLFAQKQPPASHRFLISINLKTGAPRGAPVFRIKDPFADEDDQAHFAQKEPIREVHTIPDPFADADDEERAVVHLQSEENRSLTRGLYDQALLALHVICVKTSQAAIDVFHKDADLALKPLGGDVLHENFIEEIRRIKSDQRAWD